MVARQGIRGRRDTFVFLELRRVWLYQGMMPLVPTERCSRNGLYQSTEMRSSAPGNRVTRPCR